MNAKKPKKPKPDMTKEDDPKQSEAFRKAVSDLEAAGELSDTEESDFEGTISKIAASRAVARNGDEH